MTARFSTRTIAEAVTALIDYRGKTPTKTDRGIRLITAKVVKDSRILDEPAEYIAEEDYDSWMRRGLPKCGDVLITTEAPLGEVAVLKSERVALAQRIILLRGNPEVVDPSYLFYALRSPFVQGELAARASGTTVLGIKQSELRQVRLPWYPLPIQHRIASILSTYDDLIENSLRRIRILEEMTKSLYREWFVEFRFPGHERVRFVDSPLGQIPKGWESAELQAAASLRRERFLAPRDSDLPLLDLARIPSKSWAIAEFGNPAELSTSRVCFEKGDVLFGGIRPYLHKTVIAPCRGVTNVSVHVLVPKKEEYAAFVGVLCFSDSTIAWADKHSTGTKMPVISWGDLSRMPLLLPCAQVARDFQSLTAPMIDLAGTLIDRNIILRGARDLLLPRLISGELDVSDLVITPSETVA